MLLTQIVIIQRISMRETIAIDLAKNIPMKNTVNFYQ